jgi:DNA-binding NarL/FixJ family response regulator
VEAAMTIGADGYLIKQLAADSLVEAMHQVYSGKMYFMPAIARRYSMLHESATDREGRPWAKKTALTRRETAVLQRIAEGAANKQIAADLGISIKTVEKHCNHLMHKLDIHDTASLTRYAIAIAAGIIESSVQSTTV